MSANKKLLTALFILILSLLLAACTGTNTQAITSPATSSGFNRSITVVGQGQAFGQPDQASAQVGVEIFAPTVEEATAQNEAMMQKIFAVLAQQGIAKEDIQTSNYSLWAEQIYGERGIEGISGYRVSNQLSVTIRDLNNVGNILAAVTNAGANSIQGVYFSVADPAVLEAQARQAAMADARQRAESLAQLGEVQVGEILLISEIVGQPGIPYGLSSRGVAQEAAAVPSIAPGQLNFQVQIQVTFAIQ